MPYIHFKSDWNRPDIGWSVGRRSTLIRLFSRWSSRQKQGLRRHREIPSTTDATRRHTQQLRPEKTRAAPKILQAGVVSNYGLLLKWQYKTVYSNESFWWRSRYVSFSKSRVTERPIRERSKAAKTKTKREGGSLSLSLSHTHTHTLSLLSRVADSALVVH